MCKKGSVRIRGGAQYASPVELVPQTYPKFLKIRGEEALGLIQLTTIFFKYNRFAQLKMITKKYEYQSIHITISLSE